MLKFTKEQQDYILANRREFNTRQAAMASLMGSGATMIGNATTLPRDVWGEWDREGIEIQREVLSVFNTLAASVSRPMPIGKMIHYFQQVSDSGVANVTLDGRSKANTDQQTFNYVGTPLPITDSTFSYGWRQVAAAQTEGFALDPVGRNNSMFKVAKKLESLILDGDSNIVVGGATLYGLRTHPKRETRTTSQALITATGAQWAADVNATIKLLHNNNFRVPATLFVNWNDWYYAGNTDYTTNYPKSIAQRIREMDGVGEVIPASDVTAGQIIAVVKNSRVLQVLNGMPMTTRAQFRANPEDDYNFVTMAAAALEIKYDSTDQCGIAVSSL
jgi:hypothetical protein